MIFPNVKLDLTVIEFMISPDYVQQTIPEAGAGAFKEECYIPLPLKAFQSPLASG